MLGFSLRRGGRTSTEELCPCAHALSVGTGRRIKAQQSLCSCSEKGPNSAMHCSNVEGMTASKIPRIHSVFKYYRIY